MHSNTTHVISGFPGNCVCVLFFSLTAIIIYVSYKDASIAVFLSNSKIILSLTSFIQRTIIILVYKKYRKLASQMFGNMQMAGTFALFTSKKIK